jgi:hypothetical protein
MTQLHYTKSIRGKDVLIFDNYNYNLYRRCNVIYRYRCSDLTCKGGMFIRNLIIKKKNRKKSCFRLRKMQKYNTSEFIKRRGNDNR